MSELNNYNKNERELKEALLEAAKWEEQLTEFEATKINLSEARQLAIDRILQKYKNKILKKNT